MPNSRSLTAFSTQVASVIMIASLGFVAPKTAGQTSNQPAGTHNVKSLGAVCDGVHDDTQAIQGALNAARAPSGTPVKVIVPNNCVSGPLKLGSNQWLEFLPGATLHALRGSFSNQEASFLTISGQHDVTIVGNNATLLMNRDEYTDGEWRAGVYIYSSRGVHIENLAVRGAGGDGFTIKGIPPSENVELIGVSADRCVRNGISIISGRNVTVRKAILKNTSPNGRGAGEHGPWAGIDIEPNGVPGEVLDHIDLEDVSTSGNGGAGVQFTIHDMSSSVSIHLANLLSESDGQHNHGIGLYHGGILFASGGLNPRKPVEGQIVIEGTRIISPNGSGVLWRDWSANEPSITLRNTYIKNPGAQTKNMNRCGLYFNATDTSFGSKYSPGPQLNVSVDGLTVEDGNKRLVRAVWFEGDANHPVRATVKNVHEPGTAAPRMMVKNQ